MERVALYCRVSSEEQLRHGLSLAEQEHSLEEYAKEHKMKIVDKYIDGGISARKRYTKRPELLRLLEDVKAGKIDMILFIKLDRWFRNVADYYEVQKILDEHKVTWRATQEDYETVTASGRFKVNIMLSVAQDEADRTSERIKFVFEGKRERNEAISCTVPYGYRIENKHIVLDEKTAPVARKIFEMYLETGSPATVIDSIIEKKLSYQTLRNMLKSKAYIGDYNGLKIEPIITPDERERVLQTMKTTVRKNQTNRIYLFSGLIKCPGCGVRMKGCVCHYAKPGKEYVYYRCPAHDDKRGCVEKKTYREDRIENYLLDHIENRLAVVIESKPGHKHDQISHDAERKAITRKLSKLSELYVNDMIEMTDYKRQYEQLQNALAAIPPEPRQKDYGRIKQMLVSDWRDLYADLPRSEKRVFWRNILEEIKLENGTVIDFIFR